MFYNDLMAEYLRDNGAADGQVLYFAAVIGYASEALSLAPHLKAPAAARLFERETPPPRETLEELRRIKNVEMPIPDFAGRLADKLESAIQQAEITQLICFAARLVGD